MAGRVYVVTVVVSVEVPSMLFTTLVPARIRLVLCADDRCRHIGDGRRRANPSRNNNPGILTRDDGTRHIVKTTACRALIGPFESLFALLSPS